MSGLARRAGPRRRARGMSRRRFSRRSRQMDQERRDPPGDEQARPTSRPAGPPHRARVHSDARAGRAGMLHNRWARTHVLPTRPGARPMRRARAARRARVARQALADSVERAAVARAGAGALFLPAADEPEIGQSKGQRRSRRRRSRRPGSAPWPASHPPLPHRPCAEAAALLTPGTCAHRALLVAERLRRQVSWSAPPARQFGAVADSPVRAPSLAPAARRRRGEVEVGAKEAP